MYQALVQRAISRVDTDIKRLQARACILGPLPATPEVVRGAMSLADLRYLHLRHTRVVARAPLVELLCDLLAHRGEAPRGEGGVLAELRVVMQVQTFDRVCSSPNNEFVIFYPWLEMSDGAVILAQHCEPFGAATGEEEHAAYIELC